MRDYCVYIVASRSHTLYIGTTSAIEKRSSSIGMVRFEGFSSQYNCNRLVHLERYSDVHRAIAREKQLKRWSHSKKITLIERENPTWHDFSEEWVSRCQLGASLLRLRTARGSLRYVRRFAPHFGRDDSDGKR